MDEKQVKKMINAVSQSSSNSKTPRDLYTAILYRLNRNKSQDPLIEYNECLEDLSLLKSAIEICISSNSTGIEQRQKGNDILTGINQMFNFNVSSSQPKIDSSGSKYNFKDGSSSRFEDLNSITNSIFQIDLINKITKIYGICGQARGFLGVQRKEFYYKDSSVKEI